MMLVETWSPTNHLLAHIKNHNIKTVWYCSVSIIVAIVSFTTCQESERRQTLQDRHLAEKLSQVYNGMVRHLRQGTLCNGLFSM